MKIKQGSHLVKNMRERWFCFIFQKFHAEKSTMHTEPPEPPKKGQNYTK